MKTYWVYIMTNKARTVLYVGVTNNLSRRWWEHSNGLLIEGFSKTYNCHDLIYYEEYDQIDLAIAREKQLKGITRAKKEALINSINPGWKDYPTQWGWK